MRQFTRAVRFFLLVFAAILGMLAMVVQRMVLYFMRPSRTALWATPEAVGLAYEDVQFPARDGLRLSGWFVPAANAGAEPQPVVLLVHDLAWNRLGTQAESVLDDLLGTQPVNFLPLIHALHGAGYAVLAFDLRNHGLSSDTPLSTFGLEEAHDILGALDYVSARQDVDSRRIGAVGFGMGANAVLFTVPHSEAWRSLVLVQPTTPGLFTARLMVDRFGPPGVAILTIVEAIYRWRSGNLSFRAVDPAQVATQLTCPTLFVQGNGDQWGSLENVVRMVHAAPGAVQPLYVETRERYAGYNYPINHPEAVTGFLWRNL